jgi:CDP-diacylglycerol--glycerol-3-phosphate 3-phosphatidyltransferase
MADIDNLPQTDRQGTTVGQVTPRWLMQLPNQLTWLRMACIPIVVLLLLEGQPVTPGLEFVPTNVDIWAALVFAVAAGTDFFDGWLARRFGAQTVLGKLLDPMADKLLVVSSMIILVEKQRLAGWVAVVLIVRDLAINAIRISAMDDQIVIESSQIGKAKTLFLDIGIAGLMVHGTLWSIPWLAIGQIFTGLAVASSVISAGLYLMSYARALRTRR